MQPIRTIKKNSEEFATVCCTYSRLNTLSHQNSRNFPQTINRNQGDVAKEKKIKLEIKYLNNVE